MGPWRRCAASAWAGGGGEPPLLWPEEECQESPRQWAGIRPWAEWPTGPCQLRNNTTNGTLHLRRGYRTIIKQTNRLFSPLEFLFSIYCSSSSSRTLASTVCFSTSFYQFRYQVANKEVRRRCLGPGRRCAAAAWGQGGGAPPLLHRAGEGVARWLGSQEMRRAAATVPRPGLVRKIFWISTR